MAGEILGCSPAYVRKLLATNRLKGVKHGHDWIIATFEVNRFKLKRDKKRDKSNDNQDPRTD